MKYFAIFSAAALLGILAVSGCNQTQKKTAAPPPEVSQQVMKQQAANRAEQAQAGLAVRMLHMRQGPPPAATSTP